MAPKNVPRRSSYEVSAEGAVQAPTALRLEQIPLGALRANPKNPRAHSRKQIRKIADSVAQFGFLNPLLVDDDNLVLAGHGRLEAGRLLGLAAAPAIRFTHLSQAQKRAYLIADNRLAELAGWDRELLAIELGELSDLLPAAGFDVSLTGFDVADIDLMAADIASAKPEPTDVIPPAPKIPVTRPGDLWELSRHRLLCGDSRNPKSFTRLMDGGLAAAVISDPPYNVAVRSIIGRGKVRHEEFTCASGEMSRRQYRAFLERMLGSGARVSQPGALHYLFIDWRHIVDVVSIGEKVFDALLNICVWNKTNGGQGSLYRSQHELICVFRTAGAAHRNNIELGRHGRNRSNVWTYPGINAFGRGSGTIFLAAERTARLARGIEFEPKYVDVAIRRWQDLTKLEARLVDDGRSFDEVAADRKERSEPVRRPRSRAATASRRTRQAAALVQTPGSSAPSRRASVPSESVHSKSRKSVTRGERGHG